MTRSYNNPWIPAEALDILAAHKGTLLDVGGGAAPYCGATHVVDALPYDAARLAANAWGQDQSQLSAFSPQPSAYTQLDLCECREWPFDDNAFDLGLTSHCLEDLRDPLPAVRELSRVCRQVLIIVPSRLLEQTRGVEHPRYCGFFHHPWIVTGKGNQIVFRRKTPVLMLPACHIVCPFGKTLRRELGGDFFFAEHLLPREDPVIWTQDFEDYCDFIAPYKRRHDLFVSDGYRHTLKYWIWRWRQRWLGVL